MKLFVLIYSLVMFLHGGAAQAQPVTTEDARPSQSSKEIKNLQALTSDIKNLVGVAEVILPNDSNAVAVEQRLLTSFQQDPPRNLSLDNNVTLYWGWQEGQAFIKSIAIYDSNGALRVVGAVDDIPALYNQRSKRGVADANEYQKLMRKYASWGSEPSVVLFAHEAQDFDTYLPLVQRWLQAAMLGFNVDCSKSEIAASCVFAEKVTLPIVAYKLDCKDQTTIEHCPHPLPDSQAESIPLELFTQ